MKVKLVFHDWVKMGKSIYSTEEGIDLSTRDFHSGSTFHGTIELDKENEQEFKAAIESRYYPTFYLILDNEINE